MIIPIGTAKGGPGKSTTAFNLTVALMQKGYDVVLVDADDLQSVTKWNYLRETKPDIHCYSLRGDIGQGLRNLDSKYHYVIVDLEGGITQELVSSLEVADLVLCPMEPSQLDVNTLPDFLKIIEKARWSNKHLKSRFFLSRCQPLCNMDDAIGTAETLKHFDDVDLLDTRIYINKAFSGSVPHGLSVLEMGDKGKKARDNFLELFHELKEVLGYEDAG
ncbi:AAA family ATPase [Vibrio sp. 99-8-1]|uniref:AAA family ATPase n=1 Tax=Vibrio sp. 99-8-1 TaxID=2607602 RepID=UPI0014938B48|nr:AAA family ATPase [Vibrio sp. 99-8-1]NOI66891.1 AAA family ATPase [Vibrio sp. 99-8-1]